MRRDRPGNLDAMRVYAEVARRSFLRHSTYRGATVAGAFANTVFGFIKAYIVLAVIAQTGAINGLDRTKAVTFIFVAQGMLMLISAFGSTEVGDRVKDGSIATDLYRPVDFSGYWLAADIGRAGFLAIFRGLPPLLAGALVFPIGLPTATVRWLEFVVCVTMSVALASRWWLMVNLVAFWTVEVRGIRSLGIIVLNFAAGILLPLQFLPKGLRAAAMVTPFAAMLQRPVDLLLGLTSFPVVIAWQGAWLVVMESAVRFELGAAVRKVVIQGG